jgi:hypothetical protein
MNLQQVRLAARVLVFIPIGTAAVIGITVGGRNGLIAAAVTFAVVGLVVHGVVGAAVNQMSRRRGGSPYAGRPLQVVGVAYPTLVWLAAAVQVWRTTSVPLALLMLVLTPVWPRLLMRLVEPTRRAAARSDAVAERRTFAEGAGWRFAPDGRGWLPERWISHGVTAQTAYSTSAVLGREVDGYEVMTFDGYATTIDNEGMRLERTTSWLVLLPIELPRTSVVPWLGGTDAPTSTAELEAMTDTDPEGVLVASTFLDVAFKLPPWRPVIESAADVTEAQLIADSEDDELTWSLLTPEVRRITVTNGLAGWRLAGRELSLTKPIAETISPAELVATAEAMVSLARAVQASVADRFPPTVQS